MKMITLGRKRKRGLALFLAGLMMISSIDASVLKVNAAEQLEISTGDEVENEEVISEAAAKIGDTSYQSLKDALEAAADGDTVTVLADNQSMQDNIYMTSGEEGVNKTITLDLNGKTINGNENIISLGQTPTQGVGAVTLKIIGEGNLIRPDNVLPVASICVYPGSTLDLTGWEGGEITHVAVLGDSSVKKDGAIVGNDMSATARIGTLVLSNLWNTLSVTLGGGSYGSIFMMTPSQDIFAKSILAEGYAFKNADGTLVPYNHQFLRSGENKLENVTVIKCTHQYTNTDEVWTDGTCNACGYVCPHEEADIVEGKCTVCGNIFAAQNETTKKRYHFLNEALEAAKDGETVIVTSDNTINNYVDLKDGQTITLDLNGKTCNGNGCVIRVGVSEKGKFATLKLVGKGNLKQSFNNSGSIYVHEDSTLDLTSWEGDEIDTICVEGNGKLINRDNSGTIGYLVFQDVPDMNNIALGGGFYKKIQAYILDETTIPTKLGSLLAEGYAFKNADGTMVAYNSTLSMYNPLYNLTVVKCTAHQDEDKDGVCDGCNAGPLVACVNGTDYYTSLSDAWDAAAQRNDGSTVKLLNDITTGADLENTQQNNEIVLDLNGYSVSGFTIGMYGKLVLKNSSATAGTVSEINLRNGADGKGGILDIQDDNITVENLQVYSTGTKLTRGNFGSISISGNASIALIDLAADGYAFADDSTGELVDNSKSKANTSVKVIEHTHKFQGSNSCACGYICVHEVDANGKCTKCRTLFDVKVVAADGTTTYYVEDINQYGNVDSAFSWAIDNAPDGSTLYPLRKQSINCYLEQSTARSVVLDMNGIDLAGGTGIYVGCYSAKEQKLTLTGTGSIMGPSIIVCGGNGSSFRTKDWNGSVSQLQMRDAGCDVKLNSGTYGRVIVYNASYTAGSILEEGYAFQNENGSFVAYDTEITVSNTLNNVTVVLCTEHIDGDSNGACDYCNGTVAACVTVGSELRYFTAESDLVTGVTNISSAVAFANANSGTIKPLIDGVAIYNANCTIDLNSKTVESITAVGANLVITGDGTVTNLNIASGNAKLYGGSYREIATSNGITLGSLLPDGYGFKKQSGEWLVDTELTKSGSQILDSSIGAVTVAQAPITKLTVTAPESITYGDELKIVAAVDVIENAPIVTYEWYMDDKKLSKTDTVLTLSDTDTEYGDAGDHIFKCVAISDNFVVRKEVSVTVQKAVPQVSKLPVVADRIYNPSKVLSDSDLTGGTVTNANGASLTGLWNWQDTGVIPAINNTGYTAVFTPDDRTNYEQITRTITVKVKKAIPVIAVDPKAEITYGESLDSAVLSGGKVTHNEAADIVVEGTFTWKDSSIKPVVADSNNKKFVVIFTPTDTVNYEVVEKKITINVRKASYTPNMPGDTISVSQSKERVGDVVLPSGWKWNDADLDIALEVGTTVTATAIYDGADKGNYETESIDIVITRSTCEHKAGEILYTGEGEKEPSCTEDGLGHRECTICHEVIESGIKVAAAHSYSSEWTIDKPATITEEGIKSRHCTKCDARTDIIAIPKLSSGGSSSGGGSSAGGGASSGTTDPKQDEEKPTDDNKPSDDNNKPSESKPEAVGTKLTKSGVTYKVTSVKGKTPTVTYVKASKNAKGTVTIPKTVTIDGVKYRVTAIADKAFAGNKNVTKIVIPDTIKTIGKKAFSDCSNLKVIVIKSTKLTSKNIDAKAFAGIAKDVVIQVPEKKLEAYKKLFVKKKLNKKVKLKAIKSK